jgi:hypothetical protein
MTYTHVRIHTHSQTIHTDTQTHTRTCTHTQIHTCTRTNRQHTFRHTNTHTHTHTRTHTRTHKHTHQPKVVWRRAWHMSHMTHDKLPLTSARLGWLPTSIATPPAADELLLRDSARCCKADCRAQESAALRALACKSTAGRRLTASHSIHFIMAASQESPAAKGECVHVCVCLYTFV